VGTRPTGRADSALAVGRPSADLAEAVAEHHRDGYRVAAA
jgi:hypothetical protein